MELQTKMRYQYRITRATLNEICTAGVYPVDGRKALEVINTQLMLLGASLKVLPPSLSDTLTQGEIEPGSASVRSALDREHPLKQRETLNRLRNLLDRAINRAAWRFKFDHLNFNSGFADIADGKTQAQHIHDMLPLDVPVLQAHIDAGIPGDSCYCMYAQALTDAFDWIVIEVSTSIGRCRIYFADGSELLCDNDGYTQGFISRFDNVDRNARDESGQRYIRPFTAILSQHGAILRNHRSAA